MSEDTQPEALEQPEYCNVCENFPCLGNHPPGEIEGESYWNWLMRYGARSRQTIEVYDMVLPKWPDPPSYSPLRNLFRGPSAAEQRAAEERDCYEWIEGIRRRLGLVSEVHRCFVFQGPLGQWAWSCQRESCGAARYSCLSQEDALGRALAHARRFVPQPPELEPWSEADIMIVGALYPSARILPAGKWIPWLDLTGWGPQA